MLSQDFRLRYCFHICAISRSLFSALQKKCRDVLFLSSSEVEKNRPKLEFTHLLALFHSFNIMISFIACFTSFSGFFFQVEKKYNLLLLWYGRWFCVVHSSQLLSVWLLTSLIHKYPIIIINYCQIITTSTAIIPYPNQIEDKKKQLYFNVKNCEYIFFLVVEFFSLCFAASYHRRFRMTKTQITHIIYADKFIHTERATNTI